MQTQHPWYIIVRTIAATTLNNSGNVFFDLGDKPRALELYEQALPLRRQVGDRRGESITGYTVAMGYQAVARPAPSRR